MSHFLQRVASSVVRPQVKLQPMQGSIFAPTNLNASSLFSEQTKPASHNVALGGFSNGLRIVQEADRASSLAVGEDKSLDSTSANPYATGMADTPLLPLRFERENVVSASDGDTRSPADAQELNHGDLASESLESQVLNLPKIAERYQPLIVSQQANPVPPQLRQAASSSQASGQNAESTASRRALSADREADEIHIHIGRIEVAAIAQATQRHAAAPPRKTVNLDEYLKRGDGRAG